MQETEAGSAATGGVGVMRLTGLIVLLVLIAGVIAWFALKGLAPRPTPIGEILADLRSYDGQVVSIEGTVSTPMNLLVVKGYEVSDDSGSIMVVTERGLPAVGEKVRVDGMVREVFNIAGVNYTVILEPAPAD